MTCEVILTTISHIYEPHKHQLLSDRKFIPFINGENKVLWYGNCGSYLRSNVCFCISKNEHLVIAKGTNEHQVWIMSTQNMKQKPPSEESYWLNSLICALISSQAERNTSFSAHYFLNFKAFNKFTERKLTKRQRC